MPSRFLWAVLIGMPVAACAKVEPAAPPADLAQIRPALDSLWAAYARGAASGDPAQIAAFYLDSAYLIEPDLPTIRDRATLTAIVAEAFKAGRYLEVGMYPELTEVVGDRVMQFGTYFDRFQPTGQPAVTSHGRFGAVLRRDATGAWKILRLVAGKDSTMVEAAAAK